MAALVTVVSFAAAFACGAPKCFPPPLAANAARKIVAESRSHHEAVSALLVDVSMGARVVGKEIRILRDQRAVEDGTFLLDILRLLRAALSPVAPASAVVVLGDLCFSIGIDSSGAATLASEGGEPSLRRFSSLRDLQCHLLQAICVSHGCEYFLSRLLDPKTFPDECNDPPCILGLMVALGARTQSCCQWFGAPMSVTQR